MVRMTEREVLIRLKYAVSNNLVKNKTIKEEKETILEGLDRLLKKADDTKFIR